MTRFVKNQKYGHIKQRRFKAAIGFLLLHVRDVTVVRAQHNYCCVHLALYPQESQFTAS